MGRTRSADATGLRHLVEATKPEKVERIVGTYQVGPDPEEYSAIGPTSETRR